MKELLARRWPPFVVVLAVLAMVCVAMVRLPDSFLARLQNETPFTLSQAGWAYRLLALAALAQALYGGFVVLRTNRIARIRATDERIAAMRREKLVSVVARNAAGMTFLTLVYGIAAFWVTGQRGGFWLFPVLMVAQGAWYYREVGQIARWAAFQSELEPEPTHTWKRPPPDYSPPLARSLKPVTPSQTPP